MNSVWLDTDPGFDDFVTWLLLEGLPGTRLDGVSVVAGNAPLEHTLANALKISTFLKSGAPVYAGCDRPLVAEQVTSQHLLGESGLSSNGRTLPESTLRARPEHAVDALALHLERTPLTTVVAIAPLTNLALLLRRAPHLARKIERLVIMGGSSDGGNHTAAAEFNIFADPEAAAVVFGSGVPIHMFGLNLTRQVLVTRRHAETLRATGTPAGELLADHLDFYLQIRDPQRNAPMPFHDPVTAVFLARPDLFREVPAAVEIELQGRLTRGMTVCEFRVPRKAPPTAMVAVEADSEGVMAYVMDRLLMFCG
ncbi:nucleoside hydrolase [Deinococcus altitudinis]|uniref:nucleoside hydrolase n=1 Tax=Deinococcus altitudinis TaxID=468914 RepID=UPI003892871B